jgi:hypothetical protein
MPAPTRRSLFLRAVFGLAASFGAIAEYRTALEIGELRIGSRPSRLVTFATSPDSFRLELDGVLVAAVLFGVLGIVCLFAAVWAGKGGRSSNSRG